MHTYPSRLIHLNPDSRLRLQGMIIAFFTFEAMKEALGVGSEQRAHAAAVAAAAQQQPAAAAATSPAGAAPPEQARSEPPGHSAPQRGQERPATGLQFWPQHEHGARDVEALALEELEQDVTQV